MSSEDVWSARIRLTSASREEADRWIALLAPETSRTLPRTSIELRRARNGVSIRVTARDVSALRAAMNTYLSWVHLIEATETEAIRRRQGENSERSPPTPARSP